MLTLRCVTCSKFSRESHAEALFKHDPHAGDSAGKTQGALLFEAANQNMMAYMRKKEVVVDEKRDHQVRYRQRRAAAHLLPASFPKFH
jgi:hypothetical protein